MSRIVFVEYTKDLIKREQPDLSEEEIAKLARNLVDKARTEVNRREKERNRKAIERGIDLTKNRVVSKEVYNWYMQLSPDEHEKQFGYKRKEPTSRQQNETQYYSDISHRSLSSKNCIKKVPPQIRDNQTYKQSIESHRMVLSSRNLYTGPISSEPPRFSEGTSFSKQYYGKENKPPNWLKNGRHIVISDCTWRQVAVASYPMKRKTDDNYHMAVKRQKVY